MFYIIWLLRKRFNNFFFSFFITDKFVVEGIVAKINYKKKQLTILK